MQDAQKLLTLMVAAQSFLMGMLLLAIARGLTGKAPQSLRLRGSAMLLQCFGYVLIAQRGSIDGLWSVVFSFGLVGFGHAITLFALRMLLGLREYRKQTALVIFGVWLLMLWYGWLRPDRQASATLSQLYSIGYAIAISWPLARSLRPSGSVGERILFGTALFMLTTQAWLLMANSIPIHQTTSHLTVMWLVVLMPTLTGVAFLMMYNEAIQAELRNLARIDPLTGVNNRRALFEQLKFQLQRAEKRRSPLTVLLVDVDHFKQVNDRHGHAVGDKLLVALVACMVALLRRHDAIGRIGGEEFVVVAPDADPSAGMRIGESLRQAAEKLHASIDGFQIPTTVSIGVATSTAHGHDADTLLHLADQALYEAKRNGRNRVVARQADEEDRLDVMPPKPIGRHDDRSG